MATYSAAIWSAVAAMSSAIAAMTMVYIQYRNRIDDAAPELVIEGWDRGTIVNDTEVIIFKKLLNVGNGPALHVRIN